MRTISEPEQRTLKSATDGAYELAGGISRIIDFTRVGTAQLSKYASFNVEYRESFIPVDVAIEVDRRAKTPTIVKEMAALLGYELVPMQGQFDPAIGGLTEMDAHKVVSGGLDLARTILDALLDGHIDPLERKRIIKDARENHRAIDLVLQRLEVR